MTTARIISFKSDFNCLLNSIKDAKRQAQSGDTEGCIHKLSVIEKDVERMVEWSQRGYTKGR